MALDRIHLRKLIKILFLPQGGRQGEIRKDIRDERARERGEGSGGGDFYAPFWADAKNHVFGYGDLHRDVAARIDGNDRRANLYPQLRDGFLLWWNERRRWTNEPFRQGQALKTHFQFPGLDATVKVDNILSVRDGLDAEHAVYPYFSLDPVLTEEAARFSLWLLSAALPTIPPDEFRILDVIRGNTFSLDRTPLHGDEEEQFRARYRDLLQHRDRLLEEYD